MTYISEINRFWRVSNGLALSANAKVLYLYLLHESNAVGLKREFCLPVASIKAGTGLTQKQYYTARNILSAQGLVAFKIHEATHTASIKMCLFDQPSAFPYGIPNGKPSGNPSGNPNGNPKNFYLYNNTYREEESRRQMPKTYDTNVFFGAAVARGEKCEDA